MPEIPKQKNGKRIALIGAGPASLTVARDLLPLGYSCVLFEKDPKGGGLMRTNIPSFRLPATVLDEEVERILAFGVEARFGHEIKSLKALLGKKASMPCSSAPARPRARTSTFPAARRPRPTSTSASTG